MRRCPPFREVRKVIRGAEEQARETPKGRAFRKVQEVNDTFEPLEIALFINNPPFLFLSGFSV